jgi:hypothetical protein
MNATLLCVALLVLGFGEKEILKRIKDTGSESYSGGVLVEMPLRTTDADLSDLCELRLLVALNLSRTKVTDEGLRTVAGLSELGVLELEGELFTDWGLHHLEKMSNRGCNPFGVDTRYDYPYIRDSTGPSLPRRGCIR